MPEREFASDEPRPGRNHFQRFRWILLGGLVGLALLWLAPTIAAQPDSAIELWRVILAGALGGILGDSILYWLLRTVLRRFVTERITRAERNPQVSRALEVLSDMPVLSITVSVVVTTALLALLYLRPKSSWEDAGPEPSSNTT